MKNKRETKRNDEASDFSTKVLAAQDDGAQDTPPNNDNDDHHTVSCNDRDSANNTSDNGNNEYDDHNSNDDDHNDNNADHNDNSQPLTLTPKFAIKQKVLARDTDTPLLYEAIIRKQLYAPKSKQVHICKMKMNTQDEDDNVVNSILDGNLLDDFLSSKSTGANLNGESEPSSSSSSSSAMAQYTWHYFVHYQGWNVKWDRWVEEDNLFEDKESTRILAQRLKNESKCLKKGKGKGKSSDKVVMDVMQKIIMIEKEFRDREARGEILTVEDAKEDGHGDNTTLAAKATTSDRKRKRNCWDNDTTSTTHSTTHSHSHSNSHSHLKNKQTIINTKANTKFIKNEAQLRMRDLCSKQTSNAINIPFTLKKVLTDEWEVISQCGMVHDLPATVSVMDALNAYLDSKIQMLRMTMTTSISAFSENCSYHDNEYEEKKEDVVTSSKKMSSEQKKDDETENQSSTDSINRQEDERMDNDDVNCDQQGGIIGADGDENNNNNIHNHNDNNNALQPTNEAEQEWKDMTQGLAMYFDKMLPKQLLYRHELPQCLVLEGRQDTETSNKKRYCELYPCEHLLRLCLFKLPELVDESKDLSEEEKSKIIFKLGDFVRFLQKHQDAYLLQRYRKLNAEESLKAKKLKSRLGLGGGVKKELSAESDDIDQRSDKKDGNEGKDDECRDGKSEQEENFKKRKTVKRVDCDRISTGYSTTIASKGNRRKKKN